jgi:hypothetical protein
MRKKSKAKPEKTKASVKVGRKETMKQRTPIVEIASIIVVLA